MITRVWPFLPMIDRSRRLGDLHAAGGRLVLRDVVDRDHADDDLAVAAVEVAQRAASRDVVGGLGIPEEQDGDLAALEVTHERRVAALASEHLEVLAGAAAFGAAASGAAAVARRPAAGGGLARERPAAWRCRRWRPGPWRWPRRRRPRPLGLRDLRRRRERGVLDVDGLGAQGDSPTAISIRWRPMRISSGRETEAWLRVRQSRRGREKPFRARASNSRPPLGGRFLPALLWSHQDEPPLACGRG